MKVVLNVDVEDQELLMMSLERTIDFLTRKTKKLNKLITHSNSQESRIDLRNQRDRAINLLNTFKKEFLRHQFLSMRKKNENVKNQ